MTAETSLALDETQIHPSSFRGGSALATLNINGRDVTVDVPTDMPILWVLRDVVGLTGTKFGCGMALCGASTVHLDGSGARHAFQRAAELDSTDTTPIEMLRRLTSPR